MAKNPAISIAKAFAIILMVMGHCGNGIPYVNDMIYAFHMPLFFMLSGMCFKEKYLTSGWLFCKRKISGIYWPYLKWSIPFLLLHNIFYHCHIYDAVYGYKGIGSTIYTMQDYLSHAIDIVTKMEEHEQLLGTFWFMKQLFLGNLCFYILCRLCKQKHLLVIGVLIIFSLVMRTFHLEVPYFRITWLVPYSTAFIAIGYSIKDYHLRYNQWYVYLVCIAVLTIGAIFNIHQDGMLMQSKFTMIPYLISAVAGSYLCVLISNIISNKIEVSICVKFMRFIGDHTFEIMTLHFLSFKLVSWIMIAMYHLPINHLAEFPVMTYYAKEGWWLAYLIIGVGLPIIYAFVKEKIKILYNE